MKKLLKLLCVSLMAAGIICTAAYAEESAEKPEIKILCVGNSLLDHGAAPNLGWYGSWGMAATSPDKDYYHILQKTVTEKYPDVNIVFDKISAAGLERAVEESLDKDYTSDIEASFGSKFKSFKPDIIILQIAENSPTVSLDAFTHAFKSFGEYCTNIDPDVKVVYCTPALGSAAKAVAIRAAAEQTGYPLAELIKFNYPEYKAIGLFEHAGVAGHPSDKGMEAIGLELAKTVSVLIEKMVDPNQVVVKVDGVYVDCSQYGVLPQIINGRTMVPLRSIFEALGAEVEWEDSTKTAKSYLSGETVEITIGEKKIKKNGEYLENEIDVPAQIVDSRTLVPVRAISEAYSCTVEWDDKTRTVSIKKPEGTSSALTKIEDDPCNVLGKSGFYTGSNSTLEIVKDPDDETNNVIKVKAVADGKVYAYLWSKMKFEAGVTYKVEFDGRFVSGYNGEEAEKGFIGICFHTGGKDKGVGGLSVVKDEWSHCTVYYKMPDDYSYIPDDDRFGLYGEPINGKSAVFLVDNLSVIPMNDEEIENQKKKEEEEKQAALATLTSVYRIDFNNADNFIAENVDNAEFGETSVKGTSSSGDAKFTYKENININVDNVSAIKVTAKIPKGISTEIFFATEASKTLSESKKFMYSSLTDEMTTFIIETGKNAEWSGTLHTIRFDPVTKQGIDFEVVSIELLGTAE